MTDTRDLAADDIWRAIGILDDAEQYLANDAGERDVFWTNELNEATLILRNLAYKLRVKAVKLERARR